ncbi:hypothetical protein [Corynebacterium sp.]|uniref:hypothetical protein n=1 Tax=Corynebacterium sp. TaxID=1720 RepID=UPI0028B0027E|nr:hypothetical protein [Corynebacterium sp.]
MTRIDDAADVIAGYVHPDFAIDSARALDADGHLMPDLPEPDMGADDPEWQEEYQTWAEDEYGTKVAAPDLWDEIGDYGSIAVFPDESTGMVHMSPDDCEPLEPFSNEAATMMGLKFLAAAAKARAYQERNRK